MQSLVRGAEAQLQRMRGALEAMDAERRGAMDAARQHRAGAEQRLERSLQEQRTLVLALSAKSQELEEHQRLAAEAHERHTAALASAQAAVDAARREALQAKEECRRALDGRHAMHEAAVDSREGVEGAPDPPRCTCGTPSVDSDREQSGEDGRQQLGQAHARNAEGPARSEGAEQGAALGDETASGPRSGTASKGTCSVCHAPEVAQGRVPLARHASGGPGQGQDPLQRHLGPDTRMTLAKVEGGEALAELERLAAERDAFREALEYANHEHRLVALSLKAANQSQAIRQLMAELAAAHTQELRLRATLGRLLDQLPAREAAKGKGQQSLASAQIMPGAGDPREQDPAGGTSLEQVPVAVALREPEGSQSVSSDLGEQASAGEDALREMETVLIDEPQEALPALGSESVESGA